MNLNDVHRGIHKHTKLQRVARGPGCGQGKTAGRGGKGQTARAGYKALSIFQGGATPLVRRIPKRGFTNSFARTVQAINLTELDRAFAAGEEVSPDALKSKSLVRKSFDVLKILGDGQLTKKLKVCAHRFSQSAKEKIESAGGEVVVLAGPTSVAEKKRQQKLAAGK
jgi:large subunit ribosomal protein L15